MQVEQEAAEDEQQVVAIMSKLVSESSPGYHLADISRICMASTGPAHIRGAAVTALASLLPSVGTAADDHIEQFVSLVSWPDEEGVHTDVLGTSIAPVPVSPPQACLFGFTVSNLLNMLSTKKAMVALHLAHLLV
jgi:hypothetical protein